MAAKLGGVFATILFACAAGMFGPAGAAGLGQMCGGIAGIGCDNGLWCEPREGPCAGADISGRCIRIPEVCIKAIIQVCGCDRKTYNNDCERRQARVQKSHDGPCL